MAQQTIDTGTAANDGTGDDIRAGGTKINDNFTELYGRKESFVLAPSDETTALTAGTAKITFRMPYAFTLTAAKASLTTAQATNGAGGIFTVDIKKNGTSVFATAITIDNTEKTSATAATAAALTTTPLSLADDDEMTVDISQIGDGTAKGLKVVLIGHQ